jgi:hypothetical protein
MMSPSRSSFQWKVSITRANRLRQPRGFLTPVERARLAELEGLEIDCFVEAQRGDGKRARGES